MPLRHRDVTPSVLPRNHDCAKSDSTLTRHVADLADFSNISLVNVLHQLQSLVVQSESIFGQLHEQTLSINRRSASLSQRISELWPLVQSLDYRKSARTGDDRVSLPERPPLHCCSQAQRSPLSPESHILEHSTSNDHQQVDTSFLKQFQRSETVSQLRERLSPLPVTTEILQALVACGSEKTSSSHDEPSLDPPTVINYLSLQPTITSKSAIIRTAAAATAADQLRPLSSSESLDWYDSLSDYDDDDDNVDACSHSNQAEDTWSLEDRRPPKPGVSASSSLASRSRCSLEGRITAPDTNASSGALPLTNISDSVPLLFSSSSFVRSPVSPLSSSSSSSVMRKSRSSYQVGAGRSSPAGAYQYQPYPDLLHVNLGQTELTGVPNTGRQHQARSSRRQRRWQRGGTDAKNHHSRETADGDDIQFQLVQDGAGTCRHSPRLQRHSLSRSADHLLGLIRRSMRRSGEQGRWRRRRQRRPVSPPAPSAALVALSPSSSSRGLTRHTWSQRSRESVLDGPPNLLMPDGVEDTACVIGRSASPHDLGGSVSSLGRCSSSRCPQPLPPRPPTSLHRHGLSRSGHSLLSSADDFHYETLWSSSAPIATFPYSVSLHSMTTNAHPNVTNPNEGDLEDNYWQKRRSYSLPRSIIGRLTRSFSQRREQQLRLQQKTLGLLQEEAEAQAGAQAPQSAYPHEKSDSAAAGSRLPKKVRRLFSTGGKQVSSPHKQQTKSGSKQSSQSPLRRPLAARQQQQQHHSTPSQFTASDVVPPNERLAARPAAAAFPHSTSYTATGLMPTLGGFAAYDRPALEGHNGGGFFGSAQMGGFAAYDQPGLEGHGGAATTGSAQCLFPPSHPEEPEYASTGTVMMRSHSGRPVTRLEERNSSSGNWSMASGASSGCGAGVTPDESTLDAGGGQFYHQQQQQQPETPPAQAYTLTGGQTTQFESFSSHSHSSPLKATLSSDLLPCAIPIHSGTVSSGFDSSIINTPPPSVLSSPPSGSRACSSAGHQAAGSGNTSSRPVSATFSGQNVDFQQQTPGSQSTVITTTLSPVRGPSASEAQGAVWRRRSPGAALATNRRAAPPPRPPTRKSSLRRSSPPSLLLLTPPQSSADGAQPSPSPPPPPPLPAADTVSEERRSKGLDEMGVTPDSTVAGLNEILSDIDRLRLAQHHQQQPSSISTPDAAGYTLNVGMTRSHTADGGFLTSSPHGASSCTSSSSAASAGATVEITLRRRRSLLEQFNSHRAVVGGCGGFGGPMGLGPGVGRYSSLPRSLGRLMQAKLSQSVGSHVEQTQNTVNCTADDPNEHQSEHQLASPSLPPPMDIFRRDSACAGAPQLPSVTLSECPRRRSADAASRTLLTPSLGNTAALVKNPLGEDMFDSGIYENGILASPPAASSQLAAAIVNYARCPSQGSATARLDSDNSTGNENFVEDHHQSFVQSSHHRTPPPNYNEIPNFSAGVKTSKTALAAPKHAVTNTQQAHPQTTRVQPYQYSRRRSRQTPVGTVTGAYVKYSNDMPYCIDTVNSTPLEAISEVSPPTTAGQSCYGRLVSPLPNQSESSFHRPCGDVYHHPQPDLRSDLDAKPTNSTVNNCTPRDMNLSGNRAPATGAHQVAVSNGDAQPPLSPHTAPHRQFSPLPLGPPNACSPSSQSIEHLEHEAQLETILQRLGKPASDDFRVCTYSV